MAARGGLAHRGPTTSAWVSLTMHRRPTACAGIIIPTHRGGSWINACLDSLVSSIDSRHYIYVVDNGHNENSIPCDCGFRNYVVMRTPRIMGFADANNFALLSIGRPHAYYCFLNQDTISSSCWLDRCIDCLEDAPDLGAVIPYTTQYDGTGIDPAFEQCMSRAMGSREVHVDGRSETILILPQVPAAALVVRAGALAASGPFDPVFENYYEDYDLGDRLQRAGYQLGACLSVGVAHFSGSSWITEAAERRRSVLSISNRALLACRRVARGRVWHAAKIFLAELPRRVMASTLGRPGAPSLSTVIGAYARLTRLTPRLVSSRHDQAVFERYLISIGWDSRARGFEDGRRWNR